MVECGKATPDVTFHDTEGPNWSLSDVRGEKPVVLIWIFADRGPVCHKDFHGLIEREELFREADVGVTMFECHDRYRCRVREGKEVQPPHWVADHLPSDPPHDPYPVGIW